LFQAVFRHAFGAMMTSECRRLAGKVKTLWPCGTDDHDRNIYGSLREPELHFDTNIIDRCSSCTSSSSKDGDKWMFRVIHRSISPYNSLEDARRAAIECARAGGKSWGF
jgi:hypothetical protein